MPNVMNKYPMMRDRVLSAQGWYIYAWANADWGGVFFYVGKGHGRRAIDLHNRGKAFDAILKQWNCFPVLLKDDLTEEQAIVEEEHTKREFIFDWGLPIVDGEGNSSVLRKMAARRGIEMKRAKGELKSGRPKKEVSGFEEYFAKNKKGEMTAVECCRELSISRTQWYRLCKNI